MYYLVRSFSSSNILQTGTSQATTTYSLHCKFSKCMIIILSDLHRSHTVSVNFLLNLQCIIYCKNLRLKILIMVRTLSHLSLTYPDPLAALHEAYHKHLLKKIVTSSSLPACDSYWLLKGSYGIWVLYTTVS